MRLVVVLVAMMALVAVQAKPTYKKKMQKTRGGLKRELAGILRKVRNPDTSCQELSAAFGNMISKLQTNELPPEIPLSPGDVDALMTRVFGFDIINDDSAREQFTCDLTSSTTLSELKSKLNPLMYNEFRTMYDFGVLMLPTIKPSLPPGDVADFLDAIEAVGLLDLDAAGVAEVTALLYGPYFDPSFLNIYGDYGSLPVTPFIGSDTDKCDYLTEATMEVLQNNEDPETFEVMKNFTGLDLNNVNDVRSFLCAVIDGANSDLPGVYQAIDDQGIIRTLYREIYPFLVQGVPEAIDGIEATLEFAVQQGSFGKKAKKEVELHESDVKAKSLHKADKKRELMLKIRSKKRELLKAKAQKRTMMKTDEKKDENSTEEIDALLAQLEKELKELDEVLNSIDEEDESKRTLHKADKKREVMLKIQAKKRELLKAKAKKRAMMKTDEKKDAKLDAKRDYGYYYYSTEDMEALLAQLEQELAELEVLLNSYDEEDWDALLQTNDNYYYGKRKAKMAAVKKAMKHKRAMKTDEKKMEKIDMKRNYGKVKAKKEALRNILKKKRAKLEAKRDYSYYSTEDLDALLEQLNQQLQELDDLNNAYNIGDFDEDYFENLFGQLDQELESLGSNYGSTGGFGNYGQSSNYGNPYSNYGFGNYGGGFGNYGGSYGNYGGGFGDYGGGIGNYGGSYGNYGGSYGNYGGAVEVPPSFGDFDIEAEIERMELTLDFLKKLQASGLLDLVNDL